MNKASQAALSIISITMFIIILVFLIFKPSGEKTPEQMPAETLEPPEITWLIKFSVTDQKATAYTEHPQAPAASSGSHYDIGSVAVHPSVPLQYGGDAREPIIPFGTTLYLEQPIQILGYTYDKVYVNDTGDVNYRRFGESPYWMDLFVGNSNTYNNQFAHDWGVANIGYFWYEEWK